MLFRIGINLGDVVEEGERIYGYSVNIAASLEALAEPGGICISKTAFDQFESKLPLGYRFGSFDQGWILRDTDDRQKIAQKSS